MPIVGSPMSQGGVSDGGGQAYYGRDIGKGGWTGWLALAGLLKGAPS